MSCKRPTQAVRRLALLCTTVLAIQSVVISLGKRYPGPQHGRQHHNQREHEDLQTLDAFDLDKCGQVNARPWQSEQSAFGCTHNSNRSHISHGMRSGNVGDQERKARVPFEGEHSSDGEFPFHAQIEMVYASFIQKPQKQLCSGVLVHKDIVITTGADCVRPNSKLRLALEVRVSLGPVVAKHYTQLQGVTKRTASVWCTSSPNTTRPADDGPMRSDDLAVIRLKEPVEYEPGKIQPACLNLDGRLGATTCALVGTCAPKDAELPSKTNELWSFIKDHLMTMSLQRDDTCPANKANLTIPHETCYRPQNGAGRCRATQGNPVVCYDKCSKKHPERVQGLVVGLLSQFGKPHTPDHDPISVIDLHKSRKRLEELLRAVRKDWYDKPERGPIEERKLSDTTTCWIDHNK